MEAYLRHLKALFVRLEAYLGHLEGYLGHLEAYLEHLKFSGTDFFANMLISMCVRCFLSKKVLMRGWEMLASADWPGGMRKADGFSFFSFC